MAKYLIQDIIPKEKKRITKTITSTAHTVHKRGPRPSLPTHETLVHPEEHRTPLHHVVPPPNEIDATPEDPRTIISREIEKAEVYTPTTLLTHKELETPKLSSEGEWPYNNPRGTTNSFVHKIDTDDDTKGFWGSWIPWIVISAIILIGAAFAFNAFAQSSISVIPKRDIIPMDQMLSASKTPAEGALGFAVMKIASSETREVAATGEKAVTAKASGRIVIYNEQTTTQRLIKNTRFQSPSGKIYRINESINVPKATVKSGKAAPGTFEITVYADEAGTEYNSEPVDFTVPGLKGSAIYEKVYARSKGPLTGGASGTIKSVSDADLKQAGEDLRIQLETALRTKARGDLAPSQIAYDGGIVLKLSQAALSKAPASSAEKAVVASDGEIYLVTFDRESLTKAIMRTLVPTYAGEPIVIKNLESFSITIAKMTAEELWSKDELEFFIKGTPEVEWVINTAEITNALLGTPKDSFNATLSKFKTIERAKANVRPRWKSVFPSEPEQITVEIVESIPK